MLKSIILFIVVFAFNFSNAQTQNSNEVIFKALDKARAENKQVFVNNYATKCELSKKMKKKMKDKAFRTEFNNNYIVVNIEIPKEETSDYVICDNPVKLFTGNPCKEIKFPFWYILDDSGNYISNKDNSIGYPSSKKEKDEFINIIKSSSKIARAKNNKKLNDNNLNIASK